MSIIDPRGGKPLYEQIKDSLRGRIIGGVWRPGDKLPSVRELAQSSAINPNTIQKAYRDLEMEGFVYSVAGKGCYAAELPPGLLEKRKTELIRKARPVIGELFSAGMTLNEGLTLVKEIHDEEESKHDSSKRPDQNV